MADQSVHAEPTSYVEEIGPHSPRADYALGDGDGFDPSKYDFYNPKHRTASKAFVCSIGGRNGSAAYSKSHDPLQVHSDPFDVNTPPPLSPIEELDSLEKMENDPSMPSIRRNSDPGHCPSPTNISGLDSDNPTLLLPKKKDDGIDPLEKSCELLFSRENLQLILADGDLSSKFTDFLLTYRPDSIPILAYYLDAVKALKTIKYAESIMKGLGPIPGHAFTTDANSATMSWVVEDKADRALDVLVQDDLPAFIAYIYVRTVDVALVDRVTGREDHKVSSIADGLAEVFVLSDPSRPDNPIVFTSEEFHSMTGYPRDEVLGRNCRMLGGLRTSPFAIKRFRASLDAEREHCEVLLNYRNDGSPFVNLIMCVPLRDQSGRVRYYLGAQLDITGLVTECTGLLSLKRLMQRQKGNQSPVNNSDIPSKSIQEDEFAQLSQVFKPAELEKLLALRQRQQLESEERVISRGSASHQDKDSPLRTPLAELDDGFQIKGEGSAPPLGYYKTYLLVRPHPSLRILFASPDLRTPGILQSPLMSRIGGSNRVRDGLAHALEVGRKVTAKVQWLSKGTPKYQARWIHCTPLLGVNDVVGVWMVILVDDEDREDRDQQATTSDNQYSSPNYTTEALPWDIGRRKASPGVSTSTRNHTDEPLIRSDGATRLKPRRPLFRQPTDTAEPLVIRQSARIAGKAYSFTSTAADEDVSASGERTRPTSSSSGAIIPVQSTMQPKVKFLGRPSLSMDPDKGRKPPVNMPYQPSDKEAGLEGRLPIRRTYKSLSPYGILFED